MRTLKAARTDTDLADRLRQFQVVAKVAIQVHRAAFRPTQGGPVKLGLHAIGEREFELNYGQMQYCIGRAKNFLDEVQAAERERNAVKPKLSFAIAA